VDFIAWGSLLGEIGNIALSVQGIYDNLFKAEAAGACSRRPT
jgi:hypothetical protein